MHQATDLGAVLINDVRALSEPGALDFVAASGLSVCLMHMQGQPETMQEKPEYLDPVSEVYEFLQDRVQFCLDAGISREKISIDPGFGFGKSHDHNMALMVNLSAFAELGLPILVGVSRKGMIGELTNRPIESRLAGSLAMAQCALDNGANILRVHDVAETCDMIRVRTAVHSLKKNN
jgi:dihydropteroate synthase